MRMIRRFVALPQPERALLLRSALLLVGSRIGLRILPFSSVRRLMIRMLALVHPIRGATPPTTEQIARAIIKAGRVVPGTACLNRALTMEAWLRRYRRSAQLRIGLLQTELGQVEGHAWVECEGIVVIGQTELQKYTLLPVSQEEKGFAYEQRW